MTIINFPTARPTAPHETLERLHTSASQLRVRCDRLLRHGCDERHTPVRPPSGRPSLLRTGLHCGEAMIGERDIWRAAIAMVRRYGGYARVEAATRAITAYEDGELQTMLVWNHVLEAIDRLQADEPAPGEHVQ
jgi:hypothetical protein